MFSLCSGCQAFNSIYTNAASSHIHTLTQSRFLRCARFTPVVFQNVSCRTGLVLPLGVLFHSVMTSAQLLGPPHELKCFPALLCLIINKLQHQYVQDDQ